MSSKKKATKFTLESIKENCKFQEDLKDRIIDIAERYFDNTKVAYEKIVMSQYTPIRGYPEEKVRVDAYYGNEMECSVDVPMKLIVNSNWEKEVDSWAKDTIKQNDRSKKLRDLNYVKDMLLKYPKEVTMLINGEEIP